MKDKVILIGCGGHCKSCIDVIEQEGLFDIAGVVERTIYTEGVSILGYPILGSDDDLAELRKQFEYVIITVGQIKTPKHRMRLYEFLKKLKFSLPVIVSPTAYVSRHASIGEGTIVMHHALVNSGAHIGKNCIINTKALVEHDAVVEDHCHVSTGAIINGGATVGCGSFVGSNSVMPEYTATPCNSFIKANTLSERKI
jgi:sugar O-acyltransferase (sialic acid O-acetyltransferase NeuD family)